MAENSLPVCVWPEWQFVKQIGRGAFGTVYEAVRRENEFNVESRAAVKVISIPQDESELDILLTEGMDQTASRTYIKSEVDSFVSEIQRMTELKGAANIVNVEDYKVVERKNEIGWDISIRMELLTPLPLYVSDKQLTEQNVAKIGCDICSALEICAQKDILHRDIKPENIFVNDFGVFKLGDFGISRKLESLATELSRKGTSSYMAPEVERGEPYDARADIYSLGLVLYRLLNNNRLPFLDPYRQILSWNDREQAVRRRLDGEALPAPCNATPRMADVILTACAFDPKRRFISAKAMKNALLNVTNASEVPVTVKPAPKPQIPKPEPGKTKEPPIKTDGLKPDGTKGSGKPGNGQGKPAAPKKSKKKRFVWIIVVCILAAAIICVWLVLQRTQENKVGQYDDLVRQQVEFRESGDPASETQAYIQATGLLPDRLESYYQHARALHDVPAEEGIPDYSACINFIEEDILENRGIDQTQSRMADVYYLYADSCFQNGDYSAAVEAYRNLFGIGSDEPLYYRDYAIALAYDGHFSNAESVLSDAEELGLGNDNIYYTKGEVEFARAEYSEALEDFSYSIRISEDEELIAMAYLASAETYEILGDRESARDALLNAKECDTERMPQILQELIRVDMDLASAAGDDPSAASVYRREAISLLDQVISNKWETFQTYNNLVVLHQQEGDLNEAESILLSIEDEYGSDYRWYKRRAFLAIAQQEMLDVTARDYAAFEEYYNEAEELYQTYLGGGGRADNEMDVLARQYEEVKNGGWLD